jgi:4-amino-4-deoxy-L-arabinose transferase-like glycosyltransferase
VRTPRLRVPLHAIVLVGGLLAFVYTLKNPGADRYLSLLTPLVAVLASLATAVLARTHQRVVAVGVAGLIAVTLLLPRLAPRSPDAFPTVAGQLQALNLPRLPIVTTAPDAYGVLLPDRRVVVARPGVRGLIIADGAQRAYSPALRLEGRTLATLDPGAGFVRPDGVTDRQPVRIVLGTITG